MLIKPIPQSDTGKPFCVVWNGIEYSGSQYRPGDVIDLNRYVTYDRAQGVLEYHFHDFHSPVESWDIYDTVEHNPARFARVTEHLTIIETRQPYTPPLNLN